MRVRLLDPHRDADVTADLPPGTEDLRRDLDLDTLFAHMGGGDAFLRKVSEVVVLSPVTDPETIRWRQDVLEDCRAHPEDVRRLYQLTITALEARKQVLGWLFGDHPSSVLRRSIQVLRVLLDPLRELRDLATRLLPEMSSEGMRAMLSVAEQDLSEDYLSDVADHLRRLEFPGGVVVTTRVGRGGATGPFTLRASSSRRRSLLDLLHLGTPGELTYVIPDRDENGGRILTEMRDRATTEVADALSRSSGHVLGFFALLRFELGFYLGCINLADTLTHHGLAVCRGLALPSHEVALSATGLYDACLGLRTPATVVGNDASCDGCDLVVVTGANQGGKSTFLRSVGLARLLLQAGAPVPATAFRACVATSIHSHFRREEDATMQHGKLDEELARMRDIVDRLEPGSLVLFNEPFSSTNEREGSDIARGIIEGLVGAGVRVVLVTHMYHLAHGLVADPVAPTTFLRPERLDDGTRTHRITPGEPLPTSFGRDIYDSVFGHGQER